MELEHVWGENCFHVPNVFFVPGKLFWNGEPKESGSALSAAVSILGPLRLGKVGGPSTAHFWELLCLLSTGVQTFPFFFPPLIDTMQFMTLETGRGFWMPTMMGPAAH